MRNLNYDLKNLCQRNRDGFRDTQANRHQRLQQMANDLHALRFKQLRAARFRRRYITPTVVHSDKFPTLAMV